MRQICSSEATFRWKFTTSGTGFFITVDRTASRSTWIRSSSSEGSASIVRQFPMQPNSNAAADLRVFK